MKIILSSRRHHYVARVSIFLITVALIAGMVGCGQLMHYTLTITSTAGGTVTTPGVGTFTYEAGTVVNLVATPSCWLPVCQLDGRCGHHWQCQRRRDYHHHERQLRLSPANWLLHHHGRRRLYHTVGLKSDGTVVAVGDNYLRAVRCRRLDGHHPGRRRRYCITRWGLSPTAPWSPWDGTDNGQCNVGDWTGHHPGRRRLSIHTVGLKSDGTVVAVGDNSAGQCDVGGWTDIVQVAAGLDHTVGLKSDGTVVAVGDNSCGQCNVGGWTDIIQVAAGDYHTVGLKSDGTVVAVGDNTCGQCNVGGWTDIIQVAAGELSHGGA